MPSSDTQFKKGQGRWKKGQSGNPGGKPRGAINLKNALAIALKRGGREAWIEEFLKVISNNEHRHFAQCSKLMMDQFEGRPQASKETVMEALLSRIELIPIRVPTALPDELPAAPLEIEAEVKEGGEAVRESASPGEEGGG